MAQEVRKLPPLALKAATLLQAQLNQAVAEVAQETLDAMGLDPKDGWRVNFDTKEAVRDVPDVNADIVQAS